MHTDYRRIVETWQHKTPTRDVEIRLETETGPCAEARIIAGRESRYWLWQIDRSPSTPSCYASTLLGCEEGTQGYASLRQLGAYTHLLFARGVVVDPSLARRARASSGGRKDGSPLALPAGVAQSGGAA